MKVRPKDHPRSTGILILTARPCRVRAVLHHTRSTQFTRARGPFPLAARPGARTGLGLLTRDTFTRNLILRYLPLPPMYIEPPHLDTAPLLEWHEGCFAAHIAMHGADDPVRARLVVHAKRKACNANGVWTQGTV